MGDRISCSAFCSCSSAWASKCRSFQLRFGPRTSTRGRPHRLLPFWRLAPKPLALSSSFGFFTLRCPKSPLNGAGFCLLSRRSRSFTDHCILQRNIKRLLGYSSIAHAGYMLLGIAALSQTGESAILYYLSGYLFTVLGAFAVICLVMRQLGTEDISGFANFTSARRCSQRRWLPRWFPWQEFRL